jgi:hypothetical protein
MSLTLDGRQLFILCGAQVLVVATDTLGVIRTVPSDLLGAFIAVNADGSRFATLRGSLNDTDTDLALFLVDGFSGQVLGTALAPPRVPGAGREAVLLEANADRTQLYASFRQFRTIDFPGFPPWFWTDGSATNVFSFATLEMLGTLGGMVESLAFSPDGTRAVGSHVSFHGRDPSVSGFFTIDPRTLSTEFHPINPISYSSVAIGASPLAPTTLTATVTGRTVNLTWELVPHSPMASSYSLEVQLTPDGPVVATLTSSDAVLTLGDVPPGAYHVRVRGINYVGVGPPSAPRQVMVQ